MANCNRAEELKNKKGLFGFIFLHFFNDVHATTVPTIIPMLVNSISLSLSQAGILNGVFGLSNIFAQPIFGYFADKHKRPWFAIWGPLVTVMSACLLPLSPNFAASLMIIIGLSIGTSLFHPQGSGRAGSTAGSSRLAFCLSLFTAAGSFGGAVGPLYVVYMTSFLGKEFFPLTIIPAFFICLYIWKFVAVDQKEEHVNHEKADVKGFFNEMKKVLGMVGDIVAAAGIRDASYQCIRLFLPMLIVLRGGSIKSGGLYLLAATVCGTTAGIAAGRIADKIGYKKVVLASLTFAPVFMLYGLNSAGYVSLLALMAGFAFLDCSNPITTAMAQKRCPTSRSAASSFAIGVSWGIANLAATPVGIAADFIGLEPVLNVVATLPWIVVLGYSLKKSRA